MTTQQYRNGEEARERTETHACVLMPERHGGDEVRIKDKAHDEYKSLPIVTVLIPSLLLKPNLSVMKHLKRTTDTTFCCSFHYFKLKAPHDVKFTLPKYPNIFNNVLPVNSVLYFFGTPS